MIAELTDTMSHMDASRLLNEAVETKLGAAPRSRESLGRTNFSLPRRRDVGEARRGEEGLLAGEGAEEEQRRARRAKALTLKAP